VYVTVPMLPKQQLAAKEGYPMTFKIPSVKVRSGKPQTS